MTGRVGFRIATAGPLLSLIASCAWNAAGSTGCVVSGAPVSLPEGIRESSGLAPVGRVSSGAAPSDRASPLLWTHNDSGSEPVLIAVDLSGTVVDSVRLSNGSPGSPAPGADGAGVTPFSDLEALEASSCPEGRCLYVADVGDNAEKRDDAAIHRLVEPQVLVGGDGGPREESGPQETTILPVRFPDGPTDVEAMFVLPGERIHLVSKGRSGPITIYRYPLPLRPQERITLERVQTLTDRTPLLPAYVTGAAASRDGTVVVVRSYESLRFYDVREGRLIERPDGRIVLRSLREAQGEAVALLPEGRVVLTSEAGPLGRRGGLVVLRCPHAEVGR